MNSNPSRRKFLAGAIALTPIGVVATGNSPEAPAHLRDSAPGARPIRFPAHHLSVTLDSSAAVLLASLDCEL